MPAQCHSCADNYCDSSIDKPLDDGAADVISFQLNDPALSYRHPARLPIADQHFHLRFQPGQLLEHIVLEVAICELLRKAFSHLVFFLQRWFPDSFTADSQHGAPRSISNTVAATSCRTAAKNSFAYAPAGEA